ncbi:MAG: hypothetical protein QOI73_2499 [Solirubrobacteraceae bacterium]|nr:hypothetical protein [Solirubrobacteraceae bacterium]
MVSAIGARRGAPRGLVALVTALALATVVAGCGDADRQANGGDLRAEITISVAIGPRGVAASPQRFGAGTIELLASNQTSTSRRVELRSRHLAGGGAAVVQSTGPIPPGAAASLKADVGEGSYVVSAPGSGLEPAALVVGPKRDRALDRLLAP